MSKKTNHTQTTMSQGQLGENIACEYLQQHQLILLDRNYYCRYGELDLIFKDQDQTLVIVEVKSRKSEHFMSIAETIPTTKQAKIITSAMHFMSQNQEYCDYNLRFDAVLLIGPRVKCWLKDAFQVENQLTHIDQ